MIEYWTMSSCATCGQDGWNLINARRSNIPVVVHFVSHCPDPMVEKAMESGIHLPFFTDGAGFWRTISDYLKEVDDGGDDGKIQP